MQETMFVLGPVSSLLLWRAAQHGVIDMPSRVGRQPVLSRSCARVRDLKALPIVRMLGNVPLDVIVGNARQAHRCKTLDAIVLGGRLPEGSFCSVDEGLYVCSPELCYALLARGDSFLQLCRIACELCGTYALSHRQDGSFVNAPALTSVAQIDAFLASWGSRHGIRRAAAALEAVRDGSDSPRETSLYLMLTLGAAVGGYGLAKPKLNGKVDLPEYARDTWGSAYVKVDELYEDDEGNPLAAVEYDSSERHIFCRKESFDGSHIDVMKIVSDDERRELMLDRGVVVITVRLRDTKDFERFERKALRIAAVIGCDVLPSEGMLRSRRLALFQRLFDTQYSRKEHGILRMMAGYERMIKKPRKQYGRNGCAKG